jgi:nucleoside-diphosphate-sugar epimerase
MKTVLITGAAGNLGTKLRRHLSGRYTLRLTDLDPRGDAEILAADLSRWDAAWTRLFDGAHVVVHLAGCPLAHGRWEELIGPNLDGLVHVFEAAVRAGVKRLVFASSNHVMGGYKGDCKPGTLTTALTPRPGAIYQVGPETRNSSPYGSGKLFGERLGKCYADIHGLSVLAVRIGWVRPEDNRPEDIPAERGEWFRLMWLSNRDYCQVMERCIEADPSIRFEVVNAMSRNAGMPWDIEHTRAVLGYEPQDGLA